MQKKFLLFVREKSSKIHKCFFKTHQVRRQIYGESDF